MANRTKYLPTIWAKNAPDLGSGATPVPMVTYAKSDIPNADIESGWPYKKINDSAEFNEVMNRVTTLLQLSEQCGILPWCPNTAYASGGLATGSDGQIYIDGSASDIISKAVSDNLDIFTFKGEQITKPQPKKSDATNGN